MHYEKKTKNLLTESFKNLLSKNSFNKITVKMITDGAGVIRPTFYNYFHDKYEIFEVILEEELFDPLHGLIDIDMFDEAVKMIFTYFEKNRTFYEKAFEVTGQNSFEEILMGKMSNLTQHIVEEKNIRMKKEIDILTKEELADFYSLNMVFIIKMWLQRGDDTYTADRIYRAYTFLIANDLRDFFEKDNY